MWLPDDRMDSERFLSWNWFYITRLENSRNQKSPTNCGEEPNKYTKITEYLTRLPIKYVTDVTGDSSWQGLVVEFPGNKKELSIKMVSTPYLKRILYPILDLHHRICEQESIKLRNYSGSPTMEPRLTGE